MKRLFLAGAFALSAALLVPATAAFAAPVNDDIYSATVVNSASYSTTIDASDATTAADELSCGYYRSVWYAYVPPFTGTLAVSLGAVAGYSHVHVGVYSGQPGALTQLACAHEPGRDGSDPVTVSVATGKTYYVQVAAAADYYPTVYAPSFQLTPPSWRPWASVGGSLSTFPDCQLDPNNPGEEECWARSSASTLLWAHGSPDYFSMDRDLGGSIGGPPTCVVRTVRVDCFAVSSTNHLAWVTYSGSGWRWN